jgi:hypothetical protein
MRGHRAIPAEKIGANHGRHERLFFSFSAVRFLFWSATLGSAASPLCAAAQPPRARVARE